MRVLAYDSGAERMGWSVLEGDGATAPIYIDSGIEKFPRRKLDHEPYKLKLIEHYTYVAPGHFELFRPDAVVMETLPAVGFNNGVQADLAKAAAATVLAMAIERSYPIYQLAARTVKVRMTGKAKTTKVQVRNGVLRFLPILEPRRFEWTDAKKTMDESDALGVGLTYLGYDVRRL